jgi:hypothetical protein
MGRASDVRLPIRRWLQGLGATTWGGKGWDITDEKERREAADWFALQVESLRRFTDEEDRSWL